MRSTRRTILVTTLLALGLAVLSRWPAGAHPGHGSLALVGTLAGVEADHIAIDVREAGSGVERRLRVGVNADTKLRLRKETIASLTPWIGASVVATVDYEEGPDGQTVYRATKVQVTPPKTRRQKSGPAASVDP
ncbi:MAG: hypothetical protein KA371_10925 [Acidobacteria bacterium]|nr:hypothetical protein [Acidobacteriota bacterium]